MNRELYKSGLKKSAKLLGVFAALLSMYAAVIIAMFDPQIGGVLEQLQSSMPEVMAIMGMDSAANAELIDFIASYLYGFVVPVLPMIFTVVVANNLVAKKVDNGDIVYLLASPVKRRKIVFTQAAVLLTGIVLLLVWFVGVCLVACSLLFPGQLDMEKFVALNIGAISLHLFIGGICFASSCIFNNSSHSLALGAGVCTVSYIIQMLSSADSKLEGLKYASFFTLFEPQAVILGERGAYFAVACMAFFAILIYMLAGRVFVKKDIPV